MATMSDGDTKTFELPGNGALVAISVGADKCGLVFVSEASATVDIVSDPDGVLQASSTPSAGNLGIFKSAADKTVSIKSGFTADTEVRIEPGANFPGF